MVYGSCDTSEKLKYAVNGSVPLAHANAALGPI
jgi:hypothetical protein